MLGCLNFYRQQRSWGKVIFSQASVILLTGGSACSGGAGPEGVSGPGGLPAPRGGLVETPPSGWPLLWAVRILLECLLVHNCLACLVFGRMC